MTKNELENIYEINGLADYKLRSANDLLKVHSINHTKVEGYENLDNLKKTIYEKFIVDFFNAWGLDKRIELVPTGIFWVEDIEYLVKKKPENEFFDVVG